MLAKTIYDIYEKGEKPEESMLLNQFSDNEDMIREATSVFYNMEVYDADEATVKDLLRGIELEKLNLQIAAEADLVRLSELIKKRTKLEENNP